MNLCKLGHVVTETRAAEHGDLDDLGKLSQINPDTGDLYRQFT